MELLEGVSNVGSHTFYDCDVLKKLYVKNPNTSFDYYAFSSDSKDRLIIYAHYGSAVQEYAKEKGIKFNGFADSISINSSKYKPGF